MTGMFGPQNANAATTLPNGTVNQRYGAQQTWVKDCSAPGRNDGTVVDAAWYNRIIGNLDYLVSTSGIVATPGDFTVIYRAIINAVAGGAPALIDTIKELADAIGDDPNFAVTISQQLGARIRVDAPQTFTVAQRNQAIANIGLGNAVLLDASGNLPIVDGSNLINVKPTWANIQAKPAFGNAITLNVGAGPNNLVQLDGSGKLPVLDGSQLTNVVAAVSGAVRYDTAQSLTDVQRLQAIANLGVPNECGRLRYSSATALTYLPFKGDLLKIWGQVYRIPATGIAGLANTGVFVNGLAGQNLAASTLYYVYAFMNGSVMTADFCTTGHATSPAGGNVGTEVISGGNDSRSLIGMVYTNSSSQFSSNLAASWFNRRTRSLSSAVGNLGSPGGYFAEIGGGASLASPGLRCYFLVWGDENEIGLSSSANVAVSGTQNVGLEIAIDGTTLGVSTLQYISSDNNEHLAVTAASSGLSEGIHYAVPFGGNNSGTCNYTSISVVVNGLRG